MLNIGCWQQRRVADRSGGSGCRAIGVGGLSFVHGRVVVPSYRGWVFVIDKWVGWGCVGEHDTCNTEQDAMCLFRCSVGVFLLRGCCECGYWLMVGTIVLMVGSVCSAWT